MAPTIVNTASCESLTSASEVKARTVWRRDSAAGRLSQSVASRLARDRLALLNAAAQPPSWLAELGLVFGGVAPLGLVVGDAEDHRLEDQRRAVRPLVVKDHIRDQPVLRRERP